MLDRKFGTSRPNFYLECVLSEMLAIPLIEKFNNMRFMKLLKVMYMGFFTDIFNNPDSFVAACESGNLEKAQKILTKNRTLINALSKSGHTALIKATDRGHKEIVEMLIENGADVNYKISDGPTALWSALYGGKKEIAEILIKNGASITSEKATSMLFMAVISDRKETVELLLQIGVEPNVKKRNESTKGIETPLYRAIQSEKKEAVEILIKYGADPNDYMANYRTPLQWALLRGYMEMAELLLKKGADINYKDKDGRTALHWAASNERKRSLEFVIKNGADINAEDKYGDTALRLSTIEGHKEIVEMLIKNGADTNVKTKNGSTALMASAFRGHKEIAEMLIKSGADGNTKDKDGNTALLLAVKNGYQEIAEMLKNTSSKTFSIDDIIKKNGLRPLGNKKRLGFVEGKDCLDNRAQFRDRESALRYYKAFVNYAERNPPPLLIEVMVAFTPNTIYPEKYSVILPYFNINVRKDYKQWAGEAILNCNDVQRQHSYSAGNSYDYVPKSISSEGAVIEWTIITPENFNPESFEGRELLSDPPGMGFNIVNVEGLEISDTLIKNNADQNLKKYSIKRELTSIDKTKFFEACYQGDVEIVKIFLDTGYDANFYGDEGDTPLHIAAYDGNLELVTLLINHGADVNAKFEKGEFIGFTPLHMAAKSSRKEVAKELIRCGARVNATTGRNHASPLHWAAEINDPEMVSILVGNGANLEEKDIYGDTSLHWAANKSNIEAAIRLAEYGADIYASDNYGRKPLNLFKNGSNIENRLLEAQAKKSSASTYRIQR
jgi:serine/threonine-protein phosphatase 6 regulatory ankyrin repeat subunit B